MLYVFNTKPLAGASNLSPSVPLAPFVIIETLITAITTQKRHNSGIMQLSDIQSQYSYN